MFYTSCLVLWGLICQLILSISDEKVSCSEISSLHLYLEDKSCFHQENSAFPSTFTLSSMWCWHFFVTYQQEKGWWALERRPMNSKPVWVATELLQHVANLGRRTTGNWTCFSYRGRPCYHKQKQLTTKQKNQIPPQQKCCCLISSIYLLS